MAKLIAHFAKKLPLEQFSNHQYSASIEAEVDTDDSETLKKYLNRMFALAKEAVDAEFAKLGAPQRPTNGTPAKPQNSWRSGAAQSRSPNGHARQVPATASQKKAIYAICKSVGQDVGQYDLDNLSVKDASKLIDELKAQQ